MAHIVLTNYGDQFGWGVSSPQLPELAGGFSNSLDLRSGLGAMLRFAGLEEGESAQTHQQVYRVLPDGTEYVIRVADLEHDRRLAVTPRVDALIADPLQSASFLDQPTTPTGEVLYVIVLPEDTLGWVADQLGGDKVCVIVAGSGDREVWAMPYGTEAFDHVQAESIAAYGLTIESTVADLLVALEKHHATSDPLHMPVLVGGLQ